MNSPLINDQGAGSANAVSGGVHFYKETPSVQLEQGDLIPRSAQIIKEVLGQYHSYHASKHENEMFAVLTQSCDLVRRPGGGCKSRYISLAPARPLRYVIEREFASVLKSAPGGLVRFGSSDTQERYRDFLQKLINNNDSRYFFCPAKPEFGVAEDMCILLPLSLAIRIEHYDLCISGRIAQLDDLFQAKLGWLLGQQYSRVGTPDWEEALLKRKIDEMTTQGLTWLPPHQFDQIQRKLRDFERANPALAVDSDEFFKQVQSCSTRANAAIDALFEVLEAKNLLVAGPSKVRRDLRIALNNHREFKRHIGRE